MKSSKYTQASSPNDNEYYQNLGSTVLPQNERNLNQNVGVMYAEIHHNVGLKSGDDLPSYVQTENVYQLQKKPSPERNANLKYAGQEFELVCNCAMTEALFPVPKFRYNSEQNITFCPKLDNSTSSQCSLDRKLTRAKHKQKPGYVCEQQQLQQLQQQQQQQQQLQLQKSNRNNPPLKRIQSPEIINMHRGHNNLLYDSYEQENCAIKAYGYDSKDLKCDDYGFRREQQSLKRASLRSNGSQSRTKRRAAGDGMDSEMDDPELIFEVPEQAKDCQCACDHVIYSPGYTTCLQEDRFATAPDVTRRLGVVTPLGKPESGTPPYYRAASATNSSSSNSTSSRMELSTRHWWIIVTVLLIAAAAGVGVPIALKISAGASFDERLEFASRLLQEVPLIDGHNDLPWNIRKFLHNRLKDFKFDESLKTVSPWATSSWSHTDLPRLKQGHVAAQFWAAYVPCDSQYKDAVQLTLEQIDVIRRLTELYQPSLTLCTSSQDINDAYKRHQVCSLIGVEGGHSLAGSLAVLRTLYHVGVRYLTLTSTCNTPWADCSYADMPGRKAEHGGLTNFGKSVVKEMNRLGMIVDLSHVSVKTMRDALAVTKAPVIFSHSSAHALCNSTRNVPDSTIRKLVLNKGIVMVNFYSHFLTCKDKSSVEDAVAHINHIRDIAGVDNVGLGAGYDGINHVPDGLEDVSSYPNLFAALIGTGKWTVEDLKKLAGMNFLRVFQDVEKVRDEFKKARVPPYEDILLLRPKDNNCSTQDPV